MRRGRTEWAARIMRVAAVPAALLLCLLAGPACAQGSLSGVYPNGARRGTRVSVTFTGKDIPEAAALWSDGDGIRPVGTFTKGAGEIEVAADAAPGIRHLRLVGDKSATSPRPFAVGEFPELLETEPDGTAAQARKLDALPITVNGKLPTRGDLDAYRVSLKRGECLIVAGESRALGSPANLIVRVKDMAGRELMVRMDSRTRDPLLAFTAPADAEYLVELQDVLNNYSNLTADYVYRVHLTTGPWLDRVFPPGARRGATTRLTFFGWNLAGAPGPSSALHDEEVPPGASERYSVGLPGVPNRLSIAVGDAPEMSEQEPEPGAAATPAVGTPFSLPIVINGSFGARNDSDAFRFSAREGERLVLEADARDLGSAADPVLTLRDEAGKELSRADDDEGRDRDPRIVWTAPRAGVYVAELRDIAAGSRGGADFYYRLSIASPAPDIRLSTTAITTVLAPGKRVELPLSVLVSFLPEKAQIEVEGLPEGITAECPAIPAAAGSGAKSELKVVLTAGAGVPAGPYAFRVVARLPGPGGGVRHAIATWNLSEDRSGILARGRSSTLLLLVPAG